jgi:hypothetical protein
MVRKLDGASLTETELKVLQDIEQCGYEIIQVSPAHGTPGWAHTIGLWHTLHHPEILVFGLHPIVADAMFAQIVDQVRAGKPLQPEQEYDRLLQLNLPGLITGVRCMLKPVAPMWYTPFLGWAEWFYEQAGYPVLQCICADPAGHVPWEDGFGEEWRRMQPLLFHTSIEAAEVSELLASMNLTYDPPN